MAFKSSILSNSNTNNTSIYNLIEQSESFLNNLLDLNDKNHDIEVTSSISSYKICNEIINHNTSISIVNENILSTMRDRLTQAIQNIIDYIKKFARYIASVIDLAEISDFNSNKEKLIRNVNKLKNTGSSSNIGKWITDNFVTKNFKIYHYPNVKDIDDQKFRAILNNIISVLDRVCSNDTVNYDNLNNHLITAYKTMGKIIKRYQSNNNFSEKILNSESFKKFINSNVCYKEEKELKFNEWLNILTLAEFDKKDRTSFIEKSMSMERDLKNAKKLVSQTDFSSNDQKNCASTLIKYMEQIIADYTWFINTAMKLSIQNRRYLNNVCCKINGMMIFESSTIHGEEFNSDTLFTNRDIRDFNSTEWLDLSLTTEYYELKYSILEFYKHTALKEALILTDNNPNKFSRLIAMREAEEKSLKETIKAIFNRIKELFNQFINKIKNSNVEITKYIQKNKEFIDKPVKLTSASSSGDILAGMYRIQQKLPVVPFNYETMKEDLKDKRVFFEKHILQSLKNPSQYTKRKLEWSDDMSITEYCKAYYGASMPENKYPKCEYNTSELQSNMDNIIKFVQNYNGSSFNNDISSVENEARKISTASTTTAEVKAEHESMYYSSLYNTWFNEIQVDKDETVQPEENKGNENTNNKDIDEATAFKNYAQAYNEVFLSKITATEFIANELKSLIIAHAESYMSDEQKKNSRNAKPQDKPAENK